MCRWCSRQLRQFWPCWLATVNTVSLSNLSTSLDSPTRFSSSQKSHSSRQPTRYRSIDRPDYQFLSKLRGLCGITVERSLATQKVAGSNLVDPLPGNSPGQAAHTHVPLSLSSIIWYRLMGDNALRLGRQPQAWLKVMAVYRRVDGVKSPAGWLPVHRGQLQAQRSVTNMGELHLLILLPNLVWSSPTLALSLLFSIYLPSLFTVFSLPPTFSYISRSYWPFGSGGQICVRSRKVRVRAGAYGCYLVNMIKRSGIGGDAGCRYRYVSSCLPSDIPVQCRWILVSPWIYQVKLCK